MRTRCSLVSGCLIVSVACFAPSAVLRADEPASKGTRGERQLKVVVQRDLDENDVQWQSGGKDHPKEIGEAVELLQKMMASPDPSGKSRHRIIVLHGGGAGEEAGDHAGHAVEIHKIIEMVQGNDGDEESSPSHAKQRQRVMVFRGNDGNASEESYQAIVLGDPEDVEWDEKVELGSGKVWIRKLGSASGQQSPYRLGIMLGAPVGVVIHDTVEDSPARRAGLQAGDLLLAVNGKPLHDPSQLLTLVAKAGADNEPLRLLVVRDQFSQIKTVDVKPEAAPPKRQEDDAEAADEHHEDHSETHAEHRARQADGLDELRGELNELREQIKKLQHSLRDQD